ncbi:hypothetical protein Patl1_21104 [Pistacia atlantica]|uniref:Uncharacterized protein n=1 Tax=Pistacia atlantica TaxID=434234 RepID=A0ACC1BL65_9ROSI|nr:hypothetical protein Patl1_21104 [Pistacia atlantica]
MEINFFWAGKGTCSIPTQGTYGPLISTISATRVFFIVRRKRPQTDDEGKAKDFTNALIINKAESFLGWMKPYTFSYVELKVATDGFSPINHLKEGRFGPVYKVKSLF